MRIFCTIRCSVIRCPNTLIRLRLPSVSRLLASPAYVFICAIIYAYFTLSTNARPPGCHIHRRRQNPQQREKETGALTTWWVTGVFSWGTETGAHPPLIGMGDHRFVKCAPTCDRERSWKSETLRWKVALDSEQKRFQDGASTNRWQHGRHQYKATWRTKDQIFHEPFWLLAQ